jgi:pimeloyl-ACP methyl ester carboxylesterase
MPKPLPPLAAAGQRPLWQRLLLRRLKFLAAVAAVLAVALGGSYLFAPQWLMQADAARRAMAAHVEKHTLKAGDTTWSYYEGGQGPTLVLLHGFDSDKTVWLETAAKLTNNFHVVIPDLPGWGESSRVEGASYNIDNQAARLQSFADAKGLQRFVLVGHSMGGAIAGAYAAAHPDRAIGLALVDALGLKFKENDFARQALSGHDPLTYDDRAGFQRVLALVFAHPPRIPGRFQDVLVARNVKNRAFIDRTFEELREPSQALAIQNRLDQLTMPVMGLWCHDDKVIDYSALDSLRNGLTHSASINATMLTGCGHMPMLEKPEETARILGNFVLSH